MKNISIIIPVFNEEEILKEKTLMLRKVLEGIYDNYEIILSENGSTDNTKNIIKELTVEFPDIIGLIDDPIADYGEALIAGINCSTYEQCAILEIDYLDLDFLNRAYIMLDKYDLIVGSKKISPGIDQRNWKRKFFTYLYNQLIRISFNLNITETHGLKVFNNSKIKPLSDICLSRNAVYPSELVIRANLDKNIRTIEIKLSLPLKEIRTTRIKPFRRFKNTIKDLLLLRRIIKKDN